MAKPTPSPAQTVAIQQTVAQQTNQQTALTDSANLQNAEIARNQQVDDAFKALFNWYNDAIIGKYDAEKKAINGVFVTTPVVEADLIAVGSNPPSGRLVPTPPATNIIRIPEFDGGNTSTASNYEQKHILDQAQVEDWLQNGFGATSVFDDTTAETDSALTGSSTTLDVTDPTNLMNFTNGDMILVVNVAMTDAAVIKIISSAAGVGTPPPYDFTLTIQVVVPPTGTLAVGSTLEKFTGFTNADRTAKVATDVYKQGLMDYLIAQLTARINDRKARLSEQIAALAANEDPDGTAANTTASTNAQTSDTFLTNYLVTTDISNTGLTSLSTERGTRSSQLTARLAAINTAYTGQTENYYNQRYETANSRGNTSRGTLRALKNADSTKSTLLGMASSLGGSISALNGILP